MELQETDIRELIARQSAYFRSGATLDPAARAAALRALRDALDRREDALREALRSDLGKSDTESYLCEIGLARSELSHMIRYAPRYARPRRVATPLAQFAARSFVQPSPLGVSLIISPWNYPLLLALSPLADALAAGNTAVIKPSEDAPATAEALKALIGETLPPELAAVVPGGREVSRRLLDAPFDHIFFTGSTAVGREVLRHAAEHLTPVTLELGGKSPCIVDETAKLTLAARRIVFGKFLNCGQTCVAPDYILCHADIKDALVSALQTEIARQFGSRPLENGDYGRIVNRRHFDRLCRLLDPARTVCGGEVDPDGLRIAPTVLDGVTWDHPVMQEEIFGPILPVLTYRHFDEIVPLLASRPSPLALYIFTGKPSRAKTLLERCRFGGGCVNDVVIHLATSNMGFGGVGESGMGAYHGKAGFDAFSHEKSIVDKKTWLDLPLRYQPYGAGRLELLRRFLR